MLTAVGYTTKESESILNNSVRRRLAQIVILLGYTSSATLISLFVNLYSHKVTIQETYTVGAYFLVVLLITRLRFLKRVFDKLIEDIADRYLNRTGENKIHTLGHFNGNILAELTVLHSLPVLKKTLAESKLKDDNIQILNIEHNGEHISNPTGTDVINIEDKILVYGNEKNIRQIFMGEEDGEIFEG